MSDFISLEDRIQFAGGNPVDLLRTGPMIRYPFWYPHEWASWPAEQWAWRNTCVLFDQSHHMSDIAFRGPDVKKLIEATAVNSIKNLGRNRAKQMVTVAPDGRFVGDAILFGLEEDEYSVVGSPIAANWMQYQIGLLGLDVEVEEDHATLFNPKPRKYWRYQLNGPLTSEIVEKAVGGGIDAVGFFGMTEFQIEGTPVRALNHTMAGVPGQTLTGLELWGPLHHAKTVLEALLAAGQEFGLVRGGAVSYVSSSHESGWLAAPLPAIYSQPELKEYREQLFGFGAEGALMLDGSFQSKNIEDFYLDPWELGYGSIIKFDHDFIGRDALEKARDEPHRRKVWLEWEEADFLEVLRSGLFDGDKRTRIPSLPTLFALSNHYDIVQVDDQLVGFSMYGGYTVNLGKVVTLGVVDEQFAVDGQKVEIIWGDPVDTLRTGLEPFASTQKVVRATVCSKSPALAL